LVQALLIIVGSIVVAKLSDIIITQILASLVKRTKTSFDDELIDALHRPIFSTVLLIGLMISIQFFDLPEGWGFYIRGVLLTLLALVWMMALFKISDVILGALSRLADRVRWLDAGTLPLFSNISKIVIVGLAVYAFLVSWNLNPAPWLASAGIVGIAVGFAAKDTIANLFGGMFILADTPYKIGDYIVLDTGERGVVTKIGLRSTRLLTRDDVEVTIPNSITANTKIVNESGGPWQKYRMRAKIGVAYGTDIDQALDVLLKAVLSVDSVVKDPEPRVRFREFGDSSLNLEVLAWVQEPVERGLGLHKVNIAIYKALDVAGIEIPFPQRVLHFDKSEAQDALD